MIEAGIDLNFQDKYGITAFHRSIEHITYDVADLLVKSNADLNVQDNNGDTPMRWARKSGDEWSIERMLAFNGKKADYDYIEDDVRALSNAADRGKQLRTLKLFSFLY